MKLDCVLSSVNKNRAYLNSVPHFITQWKTLYPSVDVKVIIIAKKVPAQLQKYSEHIILYPQHHSIFTSFASKIIKLLWPSLMDYENGVLVTNITTVPVNNTYFSESINQYENNVFIRYGCLDDYTSMNINIATPHTWKEIFQINNDEDVFTVMLKKNTNDENTVTKYLQEKISQWKNSQNAVNFVEDFKIITLNTVTLKNPQTINYIKDEKFCCCKFSMNIQDNETHINNFIYNLAEELNIKIYSATTATTTEITETEDTATTATTTTNTDTATKTDTTDTATNTETEITKTDEMNFNTIETHQILSLLKNAKLMHDNTSLKSYISYYSLKLGNNSYKGKRNTDIIIKECMKHYDFRYRNVLDVGCSIGSLLLDLNTVINHGCGVDASYRQINCANIIKEYKKINNVSFYVLNADKDLLSLIKNFIPNVDVVFWFTDYYKIKKWKQFIDYIETFSKTLIIEVNNTSRFEIDYCNQKFKTITKIYEKTPDSDVKYNNSLYICKN